MLNSNEKKVVFFGCPLDCDEKHDAIEEKQAGGALSGTTDDPLDNVMDLIRQEVPAALWEMKGSLPVPDWLRPSPQGQARQRLVVDEFIRFIDQDGCRRAASEVDDFATQHVLPDLPCMVAVDHSPITEGVDVTANRLGGHVECFGQIIDRRLKGIHVDGFEKLLEIIHFFRHDPSETIHAFTAGGRQVRAFKIDKAKRELGYDPKVGIDEGLRLLERIAQIFVDSID